MDWVLRGLLQSLRRGVPGSDGNLPEVGFGSGAVSFSLHRASLRCGSLAFPCPDGCWTSRDTEQLPLLALTRLRRLLFEGTPVRLPPASAADQSRLRRGLLSWISSKNRPSTSIPVCVHSRLPEVRGCHTRTCSALVVLPDFGGFLRTRLRRFVAPCSRSWGSPGFEPTADFRRHPTLLRGVPSPSKLSTRSAVPCHQGPCLLAVGPWRPQHC